MNELLLDKKICKDASRLKKDLSALAEDSAARFNQLEVMASLASNKAKKDLAKQLETSANQWRKKVGKLTEIVTRSVEGTIKPLKKDIGRQSSNFAAKAQGITVKPPKNIDKKTSAFHWLAMITVGLAVGFGLGLVFQSARQPIDQF